ncbi:TPA: hypothetical protein QB623_001267 [Pasteurella multocida]|nr:hypothetical protein [Pasteurella multocida]
MNIENIENDIEQLASVLGNLKTRYDEDSLDAALGTVIVKFYRNQDTGDKRLSRLHDLLGTEIKTNVQKRDVESIIKAAVKEAILVDNAVKVIPELQYAALTLVMSTVEMFVELEQFELAENIKHAFKESSIALATMLENNQPEVIH